MLQISRILHAGYVFRCDGVEIAFDPIFENPFSRNCHAFPAVRFDLEQIRAQRFAAVFISHYHDDHCSLDSLNLLARDTPIYLYCLFDELFDMIRALGFEQVHQLRTDMAVSVGPFVVTPREALDADVDSMFQIQAAGLNVLNVVDAWIAPDVVTRLARTARWDMVLWPFQTMRELAVLAPSRAPRLPPELPEEFIDQIRELAPRYVVPSSCQFVQEPWSWYNHAMFPITYAQFARQMQGVAPVVRLDPSVSVLLSADSLTPTAPLPWVIPVGAQDVDFDYQPNITPPSTARIAQRFGALDAEARTRVLDFCRVGLLEKYRTMELPEDSYFEQSRQWQLSVYDHEGSATDFRYRVQGDTIALVDDAAPIGWLTQVPMARLYGALAQGESLTSMYMRINDAVFDAACERDLEQADVVEDPLIRCLFNDVFGAFQAEQLKRLRPSNGNSGA